MSGFLLDTNIPSEIIKTNSDRRVTSWALTQENATLHISVISIGELRKGIDILPDGKRKVSLENWLKNDLIPSFSGRVLPVTPQIANLWGALSARRQLAGRPLSMADGLIAATALENELTLVTRDVRDYEDLGLAILNPWERV
jgi:predicted nucleic acid-binding protein